MERATVVRLSIGVAAVVALLVLGVLGITVDQSVRDWLMAAAGAALGWVVTPPGQLGQAKA